MAPKRISPAVQRGLTLGAVLLSLSCRTATAGQDDDLDLIPDSVSSAQPAAPSRAEEGKNSYKFFIEDEPQRNSSRHNALIPLPKAYVPGWSNRLTFYGKADLRLLPSLSLTLVDRLNHLSDSYSDFPSGRVQNDLNEAYFSWNAFGENYLDAGRINLKSGVAIGFNPADFFRKDAVSLRTSEDPIVLRENRLGTAMARLQSMLPFGSLTLAVAPKISARPGLVITDRSSLAFSLHRTNAYPRYLAKISSSYKGLSADLLYYRENRNSFAGADLSHGIGDKIVIYGEWSGGKQYSLTADALFYDAKLYGIDAKPYADYVPGDSRLRFRNKAVGGFSFTESMHKRSTFVEYHYNEAGMSETDWKNWFIAGYVEDLLDYPELYPVFQRVNVALWSIRDYAQRSMEPASRQVLFIRNQWQEAFTRKLDLVNLVQINTLDASFFAQSAAKYNLSDNLVISLTFYFYAGAEDSEYGSVNKWNVIKPGITYLF
jgi:hypothetical protein